MLNKIISFSLRNRLAVLLGAAMLIVAGLYTAKTMEVDVFPDLNAPTVVVMTEAKGMAPEEVERLITFPLETSVNGAAGVRRVRSSSTTGFSIVWVEFDWSTEIYRARQTVAEKIALVKEQLPAEAGTPTIGPQSSILGELMFVALTADSTSLRDLRTLADWQIRPRLLATGGVAQVSVIGGELKEYQILLSPEKMKHYGVGLNDAVAAVEGMNTNTSGGVLYEYGNEYIIRGVLSTNDTAALSAALVKTSGVLQNAPTGAAVTLGEIAEVKIGNRTPKTGVASLRGKPCVMMTVTKQPETSTLDLSEKIDASLAELKTTLPPDVSISTDVYRQERFINNAIDNVKKSLFEGSIFVVVVLLLFLMNVRTTVISLVTIPLSLIVSLLTLHLFGLTINTMSLGGMAIAIGSLVDDAIVDVENVFRHLRENRALPKEEQKSALSVIFNASREVRLPILNSTLIIIVSFVPLFFLTGLEGRLLVPLGVAFITALCASTLVALTLTPVLCSYLLGKGKKDKEEQEPFLSRFLKKHYTKALQWVIGKKKTVLAVTAAVFVGAIALFCTMGSGFLPPFNEGSFTINVTTLPGISLEESDKIGQRVERLLLSVPEIKTVGRKTGRAELDEHALGVNTSEIEAPFELADRSKEELLSEIREKLAAVPGISVEVGAPITHRIDAMLSGTQANIAIKVFGNNLNEMYALGNDIKEKISGIEGVTDLNVEQQIERPQLQITPKRELLAHYGITLPEFAKAVNVLLAGQPVATVYEKGEAFDLTLKVDDTKRATAADIGQLMLNLGGTAVPLCHVADITSTVGPNTINRENVARKLVVSANVTGRDLASVAEDIRRTVQEEVSVPQDCRIEYGGQFENAQSAVNALLLASVISIIVIFLLLFNQFRNAVQSLVILLNLPLALIGGVVAVWLSGGVVSIPSIIGFISLFGIATRNGMLLVSRYNDLLLEGKTLSESLMQGSADRLNPILMTALTSALALVPLAVSGDLPGNEIQSPMAVVILGGLFTSTLLNAFIVPIMFLLTQRK